jgi:predicted  nucleic acid-binding Zn-ribbon protein
MVEIIKKPLVNIKQEFKNIKEEFKKLASSICKCEAQVVALEKVVLTILKENLEGLEHVRDETKLIYSRIDDLEDVVRSLKKENKELRGQLELMCKLNDS